MGVQWGALVRVGGRVARPDVDSPPCAARLGRLACVWRGLIGIYLRAVRLIWLTSDLVDPISAAPSPPSVKARRSEGNQLALPKAWEFVLSPPSVKARRSEANQLALPKAWEFIYTYILCMRMRNHTKHHMSIIHMYYVGGSVYIAA